MASSTTLTASGACTVAPTIIPGEGGAGEQYAELIATAFTAMEQAHNHSGQHPEIPIDCVAEHIT